MSGGDFISMSIKNILENGINLYLESPEEEQQYVLKLFEYFDTKTEFTPYLRSEMTIEVEGSDLQLIVELMVTQSTLFFIPYKNDVFDVFTEVLKFIAGNHEKIIREFRGIEENKIETIEQLNELKYEKTEEESEEESSDDDDYEWI